MDTTNLTVFFGQKRIKAGIYRANEDVGGYRQNSDRTNSDRFGSDKRGQYRIVSVDIGGFRIR